MLEKIEREILEKIMKRRHMNVSENLSVSELNTQYFRQGNFTICIITHEKDIITVGVSKRNPIDELYYSIGQNRAFNAAIKNLFTN